MSQPILAIDIGSTKVCAIIAEIDQESQVQILGHGIVKSQGIKKGVITNIELASKSIKKAISDAKRIAGKNISTAVVSISNAYAKSVNSTGVVNIPHKDISIKELNRVMQTALYNASIPNEFEVIHVLPYNFRVDDQEFIEDPFGMNASRMEVDVNIIMTQKSNLANLKKVVRSAGVEIEGIVLCGYASAIAVMNEDETEHGVAVIDMGGQTSNLVIHIGNSIRYNDFLGVGSNHITNDLSMALHTPLQVAEEVKIKYGSLLDEENNHETIELPIMGDEQKNNTVSLSVIKHVIFARAEEALMILAKSIDKSALKEQVNGGLILTGGMTKLPGIRELAQTIFPGYAVRIASPKGVGGMYEQLSDPSFSTAIGLLLYRAGKHTPYEINFMQELLHTKQIEKEDLHDLKIPSHEMKTDKAGGVSKQLQPHEQAVHKDDGLDDETFSFDDLPDMERQKGNSVQRLINWVKQLF